MPKKLKWSEVGTDAPRRLLLSTYRLVSLEPLTGYLELEVDEGFVAIGMNRGVAEQLREVIDMFLNEKLD